MIALINGLRMRSGKRPLGFLNPFLYKNSDSFRDVKKSVTQSGHRGWCGSPEFATLPGWDATTGLGSPSYPKLRDAAMRLP